MENLSLVAAIGANNELGLNNKLIWKIREDLQFYRNLTLHENIIMGRKTFESMPVSALQNRNVIVLSSTPLDQHYDITTFNNIKSLLKYIEITNQKFIVVGGASTYKELLPYIDTMYLTEIDEYSNADTFFPSINLEEWDIEEMYTHCKNHHEENDVEYVRRRYVRRRSR